MARPNRLDLVIVVAVALITNFVYFRFSAGDFYFPDSATYLAPARSLLGGAGFLDPNGRIDTIRTPGYPLLLALFGARVLPVVLLQHFANAAMATAIYLFVLRRTANRAMAISASLLFAVDVPTIHYANKILSETLFTVVLYVIFVMTLQRKSLPMIAILCGTLVMVRPIALFWFIPLAVVLAIWRIPLRHLAPFAAIALVLPAGWAARNRVRTGVFTVSSIGSINLLNHRAAGALAIEDEGDDFYADLADEQNGLKEDADDWIQKQLHIPDAQELPVPVRAKYYGRYALGIIAQHKVAFVELTLAGALVNLTDSDWDAVAMQSTISPELLRLTLNAVTAIVLTLGVIGTIDLWRRDRALALLLGLTVAYFIGLASGSEAEARFRVPVMPQLAIAAAAGLETVRRAVASSR
jgi:hypothetical protein